MAKHHKVIMQLIILNVFVAGSGFLKDVLLAAYFGTGTTAASFSIAYYLPDTLGNAMIGSALLIATTTVFAGMQWERAVSKIAQFAKRILWYVGVTTSILTLMLFLARNAVMHVLIGHAVYLSFATDLLTVMIPLLFIYPLQYALSGFLQSYQRFLLSSATPVLVSGVVGVVTLVLLQQKIPVQEGAYAIAVAIPITVLLYTLILAIFWSLLIKRKLTQPEPTMIATGKFDESKLLQTFAWFLLYLVITQMIGFVERGVAARMNSAMLAGLTYAFRVAQVPLWIFISAVTTWILPSLTQALTVRDHLLARNMLAEGIKLSLLVSVPAEILFLMLANPIVNVLFARGAFGASSVWITASILKGYALAIIPLSISGVLFRYYAADMKMGLAVMSAVVGAIVNIGFDIGFASRLGPVGLGLGSAIGNGLNMALLVLILHRSTSEMEMSLHRVLQYFGRLLIPSLFTGVVAGLLLFLWNGRIANHPFFDRAGWFLSAFVVWALGYLLLLIAMRLVRIVKGRVIIV